MTLLETERLVRRISAFLGGPNTQSGGSKLAEDFAAACRAANLRLHQCEAMIKTGDRQQAIQLAETAPNLLDLVTVLEFQGADDWRRHCQENNLPVAEAIDGRAVECLNECYAQGIATDHPLYAAYRQACLLRNDEQALKALQTITRLNPPDTNAASELDRLDAKVLQTKLSHLEDLLAGGGPDLIVRQVEAIEEFGFKHQPAGDLWQKAQVIRCGALLGAGEKARASSNWMEALAQLDFIHRLQTSHKLELGMDRLQRVNALEAWARREQDKEQRDQAYHSGLAELRGLIRHSAEQRAPAGQAGLAEMKEELASLREAWRALEDSGRPVSEDMAADFREAVASLEAEVLRQTSRRRRAIFAGIAVALALGGLAAGFALAQVKARDLARQLDDAVAQRKVRTAEKLLAAAKPYKALMAPATLNAAVSAGENLVNQERAALAGFEESFGKLPKTLAARPSPAELGRVSGLLATARAKLEALAPELKAEHEAGVKGFEQSWEKLLSDSTATVNESIDQYVQAAEGHSRQLNYGLPLEQARGQITALSNQIYLVDGIESSFTNHLRIRSDLLKRAATARAQLAAYDTERKKLDDGLLGLQDARTFGAYSDALALVASSRFSASPLAKAALAVQAVGPGDEAALRFLLGVTNANTWALVKQESEPRFVPEAVSPAERAILAELANDPAVSASNQRVKLWLDAAGSSLLEWIAADSFAGSTGWKHIMAYEPQSSPDRCVFSVREYGFFDGGYKLSPTQPIYRVQRLGPTTETAVFRTVGLEGAGSGVSKPLLQVLDALKDSHEGSPLFRAYLYLRLVGVMELQPDAWGMTFAPAIAGHRAAIKGLVDNNLDSGDWFVAAKTRRWGEKLEQFFTSIKTISYAKQAGGLLVLVREVSRSGLQYAGFVALDGRPVLVGGASPAEIWGYTTDRNQPALLGRGAGASATLSRPALPLSPLFALANPRSQFLANAGISQDAPSFVGVLPLFFQAPETGPSK